MLEALLIKFKVHLNSKRGGGKHPTPLNEALLPDNILTTNSRLSTYNTVYMHTYTLSKVQVIYALGDSRYTGRWFIVWIILLMQIP